MNKDRYQALISIFTIQVFPDLISKLEGDATDLKLEGDANDLKLEGDATDLKLEGDATDLEGPTGKDGFKVGKVKNSLFSFKIC